MSVASVQQRAANLEQRIARLERSVSHLPLRVAGPGEQFTGTPRRAMFDRLICTTGDSTTRFMSVGFTSSGGEIGPKVRVGATTQPWHMAFQNQSRPVWDTGMIDSDRRYSDPHMPAVSRTGRLWSQKRLSPYLTYRAYSQSGVRTCELILDAGYSIIGCDGDYVIASRVAGGIIYYKTYLYDGSVVGSFSATDNSTSTVINGRIWRQRWSVLFYVEVYSYTGTLVGSYSSQYFYGLANGAGGFEMEFGRVANDVAIGKPTLPAAGFEARLYDGTVTGLVNLAAWDHPGSTRSFISSSGHVWMRNVATPDLWRQYDYTGAVLHEFSTATGLTSLRGDANHLIAYEVVAGDSVVHVYNANGSEQSTFAAPSTYNVGGNTAFYEFPYFWASDTGENQKCWDVRDGILQGTWTR